MILKEDSSVCLEYIDAQSAAPVLYKGKSSFFFKINDNLVSQGLKACFCYARECEWVYSKQKLPWVPIGATECI